MQLVFNNITKSFQGRVLFNNLSFDLKLGERVGVTGKNGSGKTTLLKIAMGYVKPEDGKVFWKNEKDEIFEIVYSDFAFAGIQQQLFDDLSVEDSIKFHFDFRQIREEVRDLSLFKSVIPNSLFSKRVSQLSAGWLNRLKLLLAICTRSKVLILDEPFSNMDLEGIEMIKEIISNNLNDRILLMASNRDDELALCDRYINLG
ncbi:MAG: ATP-binding cassette domain-containing protein [Bacteroidetes bacterium]|nr:ATP-binding cassette domain-containing protein [Bacteroidota bacterium]